MSFRETAFFKNIVQEVRSVGYPKEALSLGLELSGFIFLSYYSYKPIASTLNCDENVTLLVLLIFFLVLWVVRVYIFLEKKK